MAIAETAAPGRPEIEDAYPLSPLQEGLLFHSLETGGASLHVSYLTCRLSGLDPDAFRRAWQRLVERHAVLRTAFAWEGLKRPLQIVGRRAGLPLTVEDWRGLPAAEQAARTAAHLAALRRAGLDPTRAPLLRLALFRLDEDSYRFVYSHHHLVLDGWSLSLLLDELFACYAAFAGGREVRREPPPPWRSYLEWLERRDDAAAERFWGRLLAGFPGATTLGIDPGRSAPGAAAREARTVSAVLPERTLFALRAVAAHHHLTLNVVAQGAWALLLSRHAGGAAEVTFGTVLAGRPAELPGIERMLGMFVNTLPVRVQVPGHTHLLPWLLQLQRLAAEILEHQHTPLREVQRASGLPSGRPLFETLFLFESYPAASPAGAGRAPRMDQVWSDIETSYPLSLVVEPGPPCSMHLKVDARRVPVPAAQRLLRELATLLAEIARDPWRRLCELPAWDAATRQQVMVEWNDTARPHPSPLPVHEQFAQRARAAPDAVALLAEQGAVSYGELDARANGLAWHLRQLGVGRETLVGVLLERSPAQVEALLAVRKAGGAYLPLDPAHPPARLAAELADGGARHLVTTAGQAAAWRGPGITIVQLDRDRKAVARRPAGPPPGGTAPGDLAYVVYTSGSTGRPKGVAIAGAALDNHSAAYQAAFAVAAGDRGAHLASLAFDASVMEVWPYLAAGASVALPPEEVRLAPPLLRDWLLARQVTVTFVTTALGVALLSLDWPARTPLRLLLTGGEALHRQPPAGLPWMLWNVYGPTEATVLSTGGPVVPSAPVPPTAASSPATPREPPPIGRPLGGTRVLVLGPDGGPVPPGATGELCIGGAGVARGYLGRPAETAERFVPDPAATLPGARLYRTGDFARCRDDGRLDFLGRRDHQLKLRGFRIEPGEVESALTALPGVTAAVVGARQDDANEPRLVAWVVAEPGKAAEAELRAALTAALPAPMVPSSFVYLDALPTGTTGKVDRAALPAPPRRTVAPFAVANPGSTQECLAEVWAEVLGTAAGPDEDFFTLGGHSLLAARLTARVREVLGVSLPLRLVFDHPTLGAMAVAVERRRREARGLADPPLRPVPAARRPLDLPLSWSQRRFWFLAQLDPASTALHVNASVRLTGSLAPPLLARALAAVAGRHEVLRTRFAAVAGVPRQVVLPACPLPLPLIDLAALPAAARQAAAHALSRDLGRRPFDLSRLPLVRAVLLRLAGREHQLLLTLHHIVADGWSLGVLVREAAQVYAALAESRAATLPALPLQFADYALWQEEWLAGEQQAVQLAWWTARLAGVQPPRLPVDRPRPELPESRAGRVDLDLPAELADRLAALGRRHGATPFITLLTALQVLLGRYAAQEDVTVGTPVANRGRAELEPLIGCLLNILVLRADLAGDPPFAGLLAAGRDAVLEAYDRQELPFERLLAELQPRRSLAQTPLFAVLLNYLRFPEQAIALPDLRLEHLAPAEAAANFDLTLYAAPAGDALRLSLVYRAQLFEEATASRLLAHLHQLLAAAVARPQAPLSSLPLVSARERAEIAAAGQGGPGRAAAGGLPAEWAEATIADRFAEQVARRSAAPAVVTATHHWTYAALDCEARRAAGRLLARCGGAAGRVALLCAPGAPLVAALLGTWQTGKTCVPLDPTHPPERLRTLLADTAPEALLAGVECLALARDLAGDRLPLVMLPDGGDAGPAPPPAPAVRAAPGEPAYILYTSGSTGRPKGVVQSHHGALAHARVYANALGLGPDDRLSLLAAYTADAAVMDVLGALLQGAVLLPFDLKHEGAAAVPAWLATNRVTVYHSTPTVWRHVAAEALRAGQTLPDLRLVVLGGEAAGREDLALFKRCCPPGCRWINGLGLTESTLALQFHGGHTTDLGEGPVPVGYPVAGMAVHLLSARCDEVELLAAGEIALAGRAFALGYWRQPAPTAAAFRPAIGGERLYHTGDLARRRLDGSIEFLGRCDLQVKIHGYRIELGEIEATLAAVPWVREAVAAACRDAQGELRLAAYVVPRAGGAPTAAVAELRAAARARLPEPMVPAAFLVLDRWPLTATHKLDRAALPPPDLAAQAAADPYLPPRTPEEEVLAGIWAEVLGLARVGIEQSFFDLGGHSLLAAQVMARVRAACAVDLPLADLFAAPTVAALARRVAAARLARPGRERPAEPPLLPLPRDGRLPLSFAQERFWLLEQLDPGKPTYLLHFPLHLEGTLDRAVLAATFHGLIARHETLRTTFQAPDGVPCQVISPLPRLPPPLPLIDLAALAAAPRARELGRLGATLARTPLDLATGPLLRLRLVRLAPAEHSLQLSVHHIVADGWSVGIVLRETAALYAALAAGRPAPLAPLPVQYADFAAWQRRWLAGEVLADQLAWWRERLAGELPVLDLPADRPRPAAQTWSGGHRMALLPAALADRLRALCRRAAATPFLALLAATAALLGRHAGTAELVVGTPVAGRRHVEVEGLVGLFLNNLALRLDLAGDPSFAVLVARVRDVVLGALSHQDLPFETLLAALNPQRDLARTPLFQVLFNMLNYPAREAALPGLRLSTLAAPELPARFDLTFYAEHQEGALPLHLVYNADLFDAPRMADLLAQLEQLLEAALARPDEPLAAHSLVTREARAVLPDPAAALPDAWQGAVHELFRARAREAPARPAAADPAGVWTYGELAAASHQLAHWLRRHGGVRPGDCVAIYAHRSAPLAAAVLGALAAGGVATLLDPSYPAARLAEIVALARPRACLRLAAAGPPPEAFAATLRQAGCPACELPATAAALLARLAGLPGEPPPWRAGPDDLAVLTFTSGSTGQPKGVLGRHGPLSHFLPWIWQRFGMTADDRVSLLSGLAHDPLQRDLFTPLCLGAAVVAPDPADLAAPGRLAAWMARAGITVTHLTPAMAQLLTEPVGDGREGEVRLAGLRLALLVGDALTRQDVARLRRLAPRLTCVNLYGSTETQRAVGFHVEQEAAAGAAAAPAAQVLPLGRGMPGVQLLVRGAAGELAGIGELGEIGVRSPHLARGYLDDPAQTALRFTPLAGGERIYRTGDLGRYLPSGEVAWAGRGDRQLQVRGFRIEPAEIEARLRLHPGVRDVAVAAWRRHGGETALAAWVVAPAAAAPAATALRAFLAARLPGYMVPAAFVRLDALPLRPTGKVDRRALPPPVEEERAAAAAPSERPVAEILGGIWAELLELRQVVPEDDFFALGGHSLLATRMLSRLRAAFGVELPLRDLFADPTLAGCATRIERALAGPAPAAAPSLVPVPRDGELPLSFGQERLWLLDRLEPGSAAYVQPVAARLLGGLDVSRLRRAWEGLAARHETLRTGFAEAGGRPVQAIAAAASLPLPQVDLSPLLGGRRAEELARRGRDLASRPFDLGRAPLLRVCLVRLAPAEHALLGAIHHIVSDGWSTGVLVREVAALYAGTAAPAAPRPLPALPVQYVDFAAWQRAWLAGERLAAELTHWRQALAGAPALLPLPTDRPRPRRWSGRGGSRSLAFGEHLDAAVRAFALAHAATPFMVLLAAYAAWLGRMAQTADLVVGTPIAGRGRPELEPLIGFFANTLPLRCDLGGEPDFVQLLGRLREVTLAAYAHQDLPFERLVEELAPERNLGHTPLFQVMLTFQNLPQTALAAGELRLMPLALASGGAKFDLDLIVRQAGGAWVATLEYSSDLWHGASAARFLAQLRQLLAAALATPARRVGELALLVAAERHQLTCEWNDSALAHDLETTVPRWLDRAALRTPDAVAAAESARQVTYGELARRCRRLAARLATAGLGPEGVVAVLADRGIDVLAAVVGIWQAGGAYLPLDPAHPGERQAQLLAASGARLAAVSRRHLAGLAAAMARRAAAAAPRLLALEDLVAPAAPEEEGAAATAAGLSGRPAGPDRLAYVLYTSGSTGAPKGSLVEHRGLLNHLWGFVAATALGAADALAQTAPLGFDISVWQLVTAAVVGGRVEIVADEAVRDPRRLIAAVAARRITVLELVPSLLSPLLDELEERFGARSDLSCLRCLIATGEALPRDLAQRWLALAPGVPLLNAYGPTECADDVSLHRVAPADCAAGAGTGTAPLGRPLANLRLHLLEPGLEPAPIGVTAEVWIGGTGVGRGYLGDPGRTALAWLPDPFAPADAPGSRLYRSGDLARLRADGVIEYLGRADDQVKVRGHRIEPAEVAGQLRRHPGVREAAAMVRDAATGHELAAFVVGSGGEPPPAEELRRHLRTRLPEAMVPAVFVALDALPLTPSGKLDRRALARLLPAGGLPPAAAGGPPRTPSEEMVATLWSNVLGRPVTGTGANFFALGGHSLAAMHVVSRLRQVFAVELPVADLFEAPTVAELAARVDAARRAGAAVPALPPLTAATRDRDLPLSYAQERLWFLDQLDPGSAAYVMPMALRVTGPLDEAALTAALTALAARHEALRTTFRAVLGVPLQVVAPPALVALPVADLRRLPAARRERELGRLAAAASCRPFDLAAGPLLRGSLVRLDAEERALLWTTHHIVSDGWSEAICLRELAALTAAFSRREPAGLPAPPLQYADYALWQRRWLQGDVLAAEVAWWRTRLAGAPAGAGVPPDLPRPQVPRFRGGRVRERLGAAARGGLRQLAGRAAATPFMALLACLAALLVRHDDQEELVVGTPVAGRGQRALEEVVGFFVNTLPLRVAAGGCPTFGALLRAVRATCLEAYAHQDVPFAQLVEGLRPARQLGRQPLFAVMLVHQDLAALPAPPPAASGAVTLAPLSLAPGVARLDLAWTVTEGDQGLSLLLDFDRDLYTPLTAGRLLQRFAACLDAVAARASAAADLPLALLPVATAAERHQLLHELQGAAPAPATDGEGVLLHQLFAAQARRTPHAVAVCAGERQLSYGALARAAEALAARLRQAGVRVGEPVAIWMERSPVQVAATLAVLAVGAAFLPLDPGNPREHTRRVLRAAAVRVVLVAGPEPADLAAAPLRCLRCDEADLEDGAAATVAPPAGEARSGVLPADLAYVLFTSGSTGEPKGVMVSHQAIAGTIQYRRARFAVGPDDRILQSIPLTFDPSVWQIFGALTSGACLVLAPAGGERNLACLARLLLREAITIADAPPSLLLALLAEEGLRGSALRHLFTGGEALPPRLVAACGEQLGTQLHNAYGPTEATIDTTLWTARVLAGATVPIGRPVPGRRAVVVDRQLRLVPPGAAGELGIGGSGLARGYLGRPDLTAAAFVPDAFAGTAGARLYRSGDLVRLLSDGQLQFLGRIDRQVKVRGQRVELGEIEAALERHPQVRRAAVVQREIEGGVPELVAYVATPSGEAVPGLRDHLATRLPAAMVPALIVTLPALPTHGSGKVDHRALPAPSRPAPAGRLPPRGPVEETLAAIWSELLARPEVFAGDDFFASGGHSLLATRLASRVRAVFGIELPVRAVFAAPTLAAQAVEIAAARGSAGADPPLRRVPRDGPLPLSFGQERLWLLDRLLPGDPAYNVALACRLSGPLDAAVLAATLSEVERRHEVLRTTFVTHDGLPCLRIAPPRRLPLSQIDLSRLPGGGRDAELRRLRREEACRHFDLVGGPLLVATLLWLGDGDRVLLLTCHHVVVDGWSGGLLLREVSALYSAFAAGRPSPLAELPLQYADFAAWQRAALTPARLAAEISWWRDALTGASPLLQLPRRREAVPAEGGRPAAALDRKLPPALAAGVQALAQRGRASLFMTLLAGFAVALSRLAGQRDLLIGAPVAGRDRQETEQLIGFFVNTVVLRLDLSGAPTFMELLARVRHAALAAYAHQALPFERLLAALAPAREPGRPPLVQVLFNLLNLPPVAAAPTADLGFELLPTLEGGAKLDLSLTVSAAGPGLHLHLAYDADAFDEAAMTALLAAFAAILGRAVEGPEEPLDGAGLASGPGSPAAAAGPDAALPVARRAAQLAYWRWRLAGAPEHLALPLDRPHLPDGGAGATVRVPVALSGAGAQALADLAEAQGVTRETAVLAAFAALLGRTAGQEDLLVGVAVGPRTPSTAAAFAGPGASTLPVRVDLAGSPSTAALLARVRGSLLGALAHADLPGEDIRGALGEDAAAAAARSWLPARCLLLADTVLRGPAQSDLELALATAPGTGMAGWLAGDARLFDAATVARLASQLARLLAGLAAAGPEAEVGRLPLLDAAERHQLLREWNDPPAARPLAGTVDAGCAAQAAQTPDAVAITWRDEALTFGDLDRRVRRLAAQLRPLGVGPGAVAGVYLQRRPELAVTVLAVLAAGGAYLPLDPRLPVERLAFMLADARAVVALCEDGLEPALPPGGGRRLTVGRGGEVAAGEERLASGPAATPADLAYVIYTSGSTGRPKGVAVEHRQLLAYVSAVTARLAPPAAAAWALLQPLAVDFANTVFYPPLLTGGCLHLVDEEHATDPQALADALARHQIDVMKIAPSHLAALAAAAPGRQLLPRRLLVLGGEPSRADQARDLLARRPGCEVVNHYGPTETTVGTLTFRVPPLREEPRHAATHLPLGRPLAAARAHVLDRQGELLPVAVAGELYLGGECVSRGYLGRPDLTAERFLPDPFVAAPGERLYRTGDLVRRLADGTLEFLGRLDHQVKIRGFRLEPAEVEAVLARHPAVAEAAVVARRGPAGEPCLAAYLVAAPGAAAPGAAELRGELAQLLPAYMLPADFVWLEQLPRAASGKLAAARLPPPPARGGGPRAAGEAPRDLVELALAGLWEELLDVHPVGIHDDFFALGGHSLLAVRLMARIEQQLGHTLPLAQLFAGATVAELARTLAGRGAVLRAPLVVLQPGDPGRRPLFLVHPAGGNVLCYHRLARGLGSEQPVYALQDPAVYQVPGAAPPHFTVAGAAALYLAAVREAVPRGPYLLGGWSLGGVVAQEMVCQLEREGDEAGLLLLDSRPQQGRPPTAPTEVAEEDLLLWFAAQLGVPVTAAELAREPAGERFRCVYERARRGGGLSADVTPAAARHIFAVYRSEMSAAAAHRPAPIRGGALLVRAAAEVAPDGPAGPGGALGWERLIGGSLQVVVVAGGHHTLLDEPHLPAVTTTIRRWLSRPPAPGEDGEPSRQGAAASPAR